MKNKLMYEAVVSLKEYVPKLINGINMIVLYFQQQKEGEGLSLLIDALEGINWSIDIAAKTIEAQQEYGFILEVGNMKNIFSDLISAMENGDYVLLSDVMEYEFLPLLNEWDRLLEHYTFEMRD